MVDDGHVNPLGPSDQDGGADRESERCSDRPTDRRVETDDYRRLGTAFARGADRYERLRPGYPPAAVDWLTAGLPAGTAVADVGAGTGKLTAALAERGLQVTAVDPSEDMLAQLRQRLPAAAVRRGTGEATGLADRSVGLVTFAQSWHWVEPSAGTAELVRVLRPGGRVGWIWNFLDDRVDWVAELIAIWHTLAGEESLATRRPPSVGAPFPTPQHVEVDWTESIMLADLAALVTTRSYYLQADEADRARVRDRVATHLSQQFGTGTMTVQLPYRTTCFRADLPS